MPNVVVVGAQWGDEGKGKVVDRLACRADLVVRFQGGTNAGHTLVVDGETTVLHVVPSGILQPAALNLIGPGVVVDPDVLLAEIAGLQARGIAVGPRAPAPLRPRARDPAGALALDKAREESRHRPTHRHDRPRHRPRLREPRRAHRHPRRATCSSPSRCASGSSSR